MTIVQSNDSPYGHAVCVLVVPTSYFSHATDSDDDRMSIVYCVVHFPLRSLLFLLCSVLFRCEQI